MLKPRDKSGRAAQAGTRAESLLKDCGMTFGDDDEQAGGDSVAVWARRVAGAALIVFGLAVLLSNLVGDT